MSDRYQSILSGFGDVRALVIGDAMTDVYHFGHVTKISAEAPIPVFVEDREDRRPGGAANVAESLRRLGCRVTEFFVSTGQRSVKHRYLVGQHQMFRHDKDQVSQPDESQRPDLQGVDVVVISDYAKGWASEALCRDVIRDATCLHIPVVVDPKGSDWRKYAGCTVICPNAAESEAQTCKTSFANIVAKKGDKGMLVYTKGGFHEIPAQAKHVYDVCSAGDSVTAVIAAYLGAGGTELVEAAEIASKAAAYVVGEIGTVPISIEKLREVV